MNGDGFQLPDPMMIARYLPIIIVSLVLVALVFIVWVKVKDRKAERARSAQAQFWVSVQRQEG